MSGAEVKKIQTKEANRKVAGQKLWNACEVGNKKGKTPGF